MLYGALVYMYILFSEIQKKQSYRIWKDLLAIFLLGYAFLISYLMYRDPTNCIPFQIGFIIELLLIAFRTTTKTMSSSQLLLRRLYYGSLLLLLGGSSFWIVERILCPRYHMYLNYFQFHMIWHCLAGTSVFLWLQWARCVKAYEVGKDPHLVYLFHVLPVVQVYKQKSEA
eukprot:TRINITY_DN2805_c0_g1_i1.p1 TRINITY_DN2805_c0_g1~~TRINITY_DN2805_c0_g1_i1.p1  ORF type:complete len:171 (-),score=8.59 TRINITY_DN2805_c0_g1_i1:93-605(-)